MNRRVATIISRVFDPFVMLAILFVLQFYGSPVFILAFLLMIALPLSFFIVAWKTKFIGDWDVSDRTQRPKILWTLVVMVILASIIVRTTLTVPVLIALIGFAVVTHFWKMSGHALAAALTTGFVISLLGWVWWPVLFIVPLVGWARVVRKDHTIWQVAAGALYSWVLVYIFSQ